MPSEVKQLLFLVSVPLLLYLSKLSLTAARDLAAVILLCLVCCPLSKELKFPRSM